MPEYLIVGYFQSKEGFWKLSSVISKSDYFEAWVDWNSYLK